MVDNLIVQNVMSTILTVAQIDTPISEVKKLMNLNDVHHIPIVDGSMLLGIVSIKDIDEHELVDHKRPELENLEILDQNSSVEEIMHTSVTGVFPETPLHEAAEILTMSTFSCLPVCDHDKNLVGLLTNVDFVRMVRDYFQP